jgi:hypothetical protein
MPLPDVGRRTSAVTKVSRQTPVAPLAGLVPVTVGRLTVGTPDTTSNRSKPTVIGPRSFLCIAISPARAALEKNAVFFAPVRVIDCESWVSAPPLTR